MWRKIKMSISVLVACSTLAACIWRPPAPGRDEMIPVGPDQEADLVVFFKSGTTSEEIYKFTNETISTPGERGYRSLPGIWRTFYLLPVDGHEGYAIEFFPNATEQQRKYVKARVKSSPIVYKVLEDVVPEEIKKID